MEINKEVTITLTSEEVEEIIKDHLRDRDYNIDNVRFVIEDVYLPNHGEFPPRPTLTKIICEGKI